MLVSKFCLQIEFCYYLSVVIFFDNPFLTALAKFIQLAY